MKITKPEQVTYFICRDDEVFEVKAYGKIETTQEMITPHPIVDTYVVEQEWLDKLAEAGITFEEEIV